MVLILSDEVPSIELEKITRVDKAFEYVLLLIGGLAAGLLSLVFILSQKTLS